MRAGPIIAGSILLLVGVAGTVGGGFMRSMGDLCIEMRCDGMDEALMLTVVGNAVFLGGALAGLAGIGLIVAGIVTEPKARTIPVEGAPTTRPCPNCSAAAAFDARYCSSCGSAIAPIAAR